ncbi:MAG: FAD-dependent oxidoreductase [Pseudomonadota bacterium]
MQFPHLFSPITLGATTVKNRIVSTGHHTYLADGVPGDALIAYHRARAEGGAGLIVSEIVAVHETAGFASQLLNASSPDTIGAFAQLAQACHEYDCKLFAQLFHPGREILSTKSGFAPIAYAPSAVPNERFHIMPKPMSVALIEDIIDGFGRNAAHLLAAGFDGVEIVGSHGYLPAQFLNPNVNQRDDAYGGDFGRRLTFVRQCIETIRQRADGLCVGLRLSADDLEPNGLNNDSIVRICAELDDEVDYFSVVAGSSATLGASVHITAPMGVEAAYVAPMSATICARVNSPVLVTGRINQPQEAEQIIATGQADLCGMTRALICDPQMPQKARAEQSDDIRACIACNQSCIGRAHKGLGISCIQNPQSGRETQFPSLIPTTRKKRVLIAGGGPAGMKAAVIAAQRGHRVTLCEKNTQLGGQALLAQRLPGREEFGGIVTNLLREMDHAGVAVERNCPVTLNTLREKNPDTVVVATGAQHYAPDLEALDTSRTCSIDDVLWGNAKVGASVVIADWKADWIGLGLAEKLASEGRHVRLYVNAALAGEALQLYTRNHYVGRLRKRGVEVITHARLFGSDENTVYFQDTLSDEPILAEDVDTLVLAMGRQPVCELENALAGEGIDYAAIGDCVIARSAEEAVYEAFETAIGI